MLRKTLAVAFGLALGGAASAGPMFVNTLSIPGTAGDRYGTSVNDGRLGFFSDLYYDPIRNEWWGLSDRGPGGGTLPYDTRVQRFTIEIDPLTARINDFRVVETIKFSDGGPRRTLNGLAPSPTDELGRAFDPEGFVISPKNGHFLVSDEYGPSLYEFNRQGELVHAFETPANLVPRNATSGVPNYAGDIANTAGKRTNRGFEGLAVSPDGQYAFAMLQSAMLDEGGGNGVFNRIVQFDLDTGRVVAQYAYRMGGASQGRGISALVALNATEFLVLERNNRGVGVGAELTPPIKRVYRIDIAGASDVTTIDLDAPGALFQTVSKAAAPLIDLAVNPVQALGDKVPEKLEGLAIGPRLPSGDYIVLAGTDNDYSVTQNASSVQFDVYFRFDDTDPYATSIQCPLGTTAGCVSTATGTDAVLTGDHKLLPGILYAYKASADDLAGYVAPSGRCLARNGENSAACGRPVSR